MTSKPLWSNTPLVRSAHISNLLDCSAYLKLENLQNSQSFKYRGISLFAQECKRQHGPNVHLVIGSGGNAGLALATACNVLTIRCTVYLPEETSAEVVNFLKKERAEVTLGGTYYLQATQRAQEAARTQPNTIAVPAYDDPTLRQGHASMINEIQEALSCKPDAIFCSVGGGGLLGGVLVGCRSVGWDDVSVIAMETQGSDCFYHSVSLNPGQFGPDLPPNTEISLDEHHNVKLAHLEHITSRASSLGASSPAPAVVSLALERAGGIRCVGIPDGLAMQTAVRFAEDHKMNCELACSTTLSAAYNKDMFNRLMAATARASPQQAEHSERIVVFVVCGGYKITLEEMEEYRHSTLEVLASGQKCWNVSCDGEKWDVPIQ